MHFQHITSVLTVLYCMSKKPWPDLYSKLPHKMGQDNGQIVVTSCYSFLQPGNLTEKTGNSAHLADHNS